MIRARLVAATFGNRFCAFHHQGTADFAEIAGRLRLDRIFAIGVIRA